jgi:hypothetical protein
MSNKRKTTTTEPVSKKKGENLNWTLLDEINLVKTLLTFAKNNNSDGSFDWKEIITDL